MILLCGICGTGTRFVPGTPEMCGPWRVTPVSDWLGHLFSPRDLYEDSLKERREKKQVNWGTQCVAGGRDGGSRGKTCIPLPIPKGAKPPAFS